MRALIIGIGAAGSHSKTATVDNYIRLPKKPFGLGNVRVTIAAWTVHNPLCLKGVRQTTTHESICTHHDYQWLSRPHRQTVCS